MRRRGLRLRDDLRVRIALAAAAIAAAASLLVSAISLAWAMRTAEQDLAVMGQQFADRLAGEVVLGMLAGNRALVEEEARRYLEYRDVAGVTIHTLPASGGDAPFVTVGEAAASTPIAGAAAPDVAVFRAPILLAPAFAAEELGGGGEPQQLGTAAVTLSRARLQESAFAALRLHLLVLLGAFLLAVSAALFIARRLVRPVERLTEAAERIGAGDRSVQVPVESDDVLGRLSATFNRMSADVRRSSEELEQRVEERTEALRELNRELESFSYSVSHDLRAPLRHIAGFVELLRERAGPGLDEQSRRYVGLIAEAAGRMGRLIDDLLTLSRIGRASMKQVEVSMEQVVADVRRDLAPDTAGRDIEWQVGRLPVVHGDPMLLRAAVTNLLSNALKYSRPRSPARIEVSCEETEREVICHIRDNGVGFDMRFVDKLFGAFQRLHRSEQFEGTGIGLATVRRIIQRHGGRVWAEGEVEKGATFSFSLPRREVSG